MGIFGSKDNQAAATDNLAPSAPVPEPAIAAVPVPLPQPVTSVQPPIPTPPAPAAPTADEYIMTPAPEPAVTPAYPAEISTQAISAPSMPAQPAPVEPVIPEPVTTDSLASDVPDILAGGDELSSLKQQALQQLSPLVNHLQQSPEERFQTTMMMLQATDDQSLIKVAYDVAQEITDEQARAQALLDVINEINYFTQHKSENNEGI